MADLPANHEPSGLLIPHQIAVLGDHATRRFIEFFARIRSDNTREAYLRATRRFFEWLEGRDVPLKKLRHPVVAAYIRELRDEHGLSPSSVNQHLTALRGLFDDFVISEVIPFNPTSSVKGPKLERGGSEASQRGKSAALSREDARRMLDAIDVSSVVGLRDRALLALMVFSVARISAALAMDVCDYYQDGKRWCVRLHDKGGKERPVHGTLKEYLDTYIDAAGIARDLSGPLFRTARGKTKTLTTNRVSRFDAHSMIQRRAKDAGITAPIGNHTFKATGLANYLENGGSLTIAQQMAAHESVDTTQLYDPREATITLDEIERIKI